MELGTEGVSQLAYCDMGRELTRRVEGEECEVMDCGGDSALAKS